MDLKQNITDIIIANTNDDLSENLNLVEEIMDAVVDFITERDKNVGIREKALEQSVKINTGTGSTIPHVLDDADRIVKYLLS